MFSHLHDIYMKGILKKLEQIAEWPENNPDLKVTDRYSTTNYINKISQIQYQKDKEKHQKEILGIINYIKKLI